MIEIITTSDGSHSLLNKSLNETYHSVHGARHESQYVFIKNGLDFFVNRYLPKEISILEIGFGTGLNALLTLQYALEAPQLNINYVTLEAFPLEPAIWSALNYAEPTSVTEHFSTLHLATWDEPFKILENFHLHKIKDTLEQVVFPASAFDLVYFDAFAPSKQPQMWSLPMLQKVVATMKGNGVFVTYCAKGQLKRDLKSLGLEVTTLVGPPGKKEMVRAVKF